MILIVYAHVILYYDLYINAQEIYLYEFMFGVGYFHKINKNNS